MRKFKKLYYALALAGLVVTTSCEVSELELLTSPNNVTSDSADPSFVLNDIQLSFNGIFGGYSGPAAAITRQVNQFSTYNNVVSAPTLNGEWGSSYQLFANIDVLEDIDASLMNRRWKRWSTLPLRCRIHPRGLFLFPFSGFYW